MNDDEDVDQVWSCMFVLNPAPKCSSTIQNLPASAWTNKRKPHFCDVVCLTLTNENLAFEFTAKQGDPMR